MARKRILIVTRNLPPLVGGMERLNWHMAEELAKFAEVRVIGPSGSAALAPKNVVVTEARLKPLWRFLLGAQWQAWQHARRWRPDWIIAGSGLTAPAARRAARACGAKTAVYVHGLDVAVRHQLYRALWLPAVCNMYRVIANSRATVELCQGVGIDAARISIVHPGVELPDHLPEVQATTDFRTRHGLAHRPLLLSVGRLSARKGLREFVEQALPHIVAAQPDAVLLIVGDAPSQALHAEAQTPESILAAASRAGVEQHVKFLGRVSEADLLAAYQAASVHVFPVRAISGDPEGFGMVAVEAAAHGLATVAFATGGVVDAVAEGKSGHLVDPDDYGAFTDAVLQTLAEHEAMRRSCVAFAQHFAWPAFGRQIVALLQDVKAAIPSERIQP